MTITRSKKFLFTVLMSSCALLSGCLESQFELAKESRMPAWVALPPNTSRSDVTLTLRYYTKTFGDDAVFIVKSKSGARIAKLHAQVKNRYPIYLDDAPLQAKRSPAQPAYEILDFHGTTEIIEHHGGNIFHYVDDPAIRDKVLARLKP